MSEQFAEKAAGAHRRNWQPCVWSRDPSSLSHCAGRYACWGVNPAPCPLHSPRAYAQVGRHRTPPGTPTRTQDVA